MSKPVKLAVEPDQGLLFESWLSKWAQEIAEAQEHTKKDLPISPEGIQPDLTMTTRTYPKISELLADVEAYLLKCRAQETLVVKSDPKFSDLSAPERKAIIEGRLAEIIKVKEILKATIAALHERSFALMSYRAYEREALRLSGPAEE